MMNRLSNLSGDWGRMDLADEVVEVSLLLPATQASALESVAHEHGLTAAELLRSLLRDFLTGPGAAEGPLALLAHRH